MNMMTSPPRPDRAPIAHISLMVLLRRHSAQEIGDAIEILIDALDTLAGDPDREDDDSDTNADERGYSDASYPEWHTRGRHKLTAYGAELHGHDRHGWLYHEDAEDGDADEDHDQDEGVDDQGEDLREDAEPCTWPERDRQPDVMSGGLAVAWDDYEPQRVPAMMRPTASNDA